MSASSGGWRLKNRDPTSTTNVKNTGGGIWIAVCGASCRYHIDRSVLLARAAPTVGVSRTPVPRDDENIGSAKGRVEPREPMDLDWWRGQVNEIRCIAKLS